MKRWTHVLFVAMLLAAFSGVASANFTGPYYDTWIDKNVTGHYPTLPVLPVLDQGSSCNDDYIAYIQFDVSNILTVDSASLTLTQVDTPVGLNYGPTLTLYGVADFNSATLSGKSYPVPSAGTVIQSIALPTSLPAGYTVTWGGASNAGLKNYIQQQADGDNVVTLAMSFSLDCFDVSSNIAFSSQEGAHPPVLTIAGTKVDPNAISLSTFSADDSKVTWPLYAGLGALALIVAGGLAISRRRAAVR